MKGKTSNNFIIFVNQRRSILAKFHALFWRIFKNVKLSNYLVVYFFSRNPKNLFLFTDLIFKFFSVFAFFLLGFAAPAVYAKKWKDGVADPSCFQVKMISYFYSIIYRFEYGVPCFSIHFILLVRIVLFGMLRMQLAESWRAIMEGWWFW